MNAIGIRGTLLNWFENHLAERKQAVVLHGSRSDYLTVPSGVPQGSVPAPLQFLVYINDIVEDNESVIKLFADYISMYLGLENPHIQAETMILIWQWANKWKIDFNKRKTELMNITRNKKNTNFNP